LKNGEDPELQIITDVRFFDPQEIRKLESGTIHGIFRLVDNPEDVIRLSGFYRI
jgi:hypothetical protein